MREDDASARTGSRDVPADAFGARWRSTERELRRSLRGLHADADEIDDLCQDTAVIAWRSRDRIGASETDLIRWSIVVAQRLFKRRRRPRALTEQLSGLDELMSAANVEPIDTERAVEARLELERVQAALADLPQSQRSAIVRRLLDLPSGATKREQDANAAALARARKRLGRAGGLGGLWRSRRPWQPHSRPAQLALNMIGGTAAIAMVALPVLTVRVVLAAPPPQAALAQPVGYTQRQIERERTHGNEHVETSAASAATAGRSPGPDANAECISSIVSTWRAADAEERWASARQALASYADPATARRVVSVASSTAPIDSHLDAEDLGARAETLLAKLTQTDVQLVCRGVTRVAPGRSGRVS